MSPSKKTIREQILSIRNSLDPDEARKKSRLIFQNLKTLSVFNDAKTVHTYVSSKKNEVDTIEIISYLLSSGKKVVVPVVDKEKKILRNSELKSLTNLKKSTFGILEPEEIIDVDINEIDLVLVPAIAVDRVGNRIGFGGGYYDKFLSQVSCPKIALVYNFQIVDEIKPSQNDIPVDFIVTETEIINCGRMKQ
ncbi:5-formyltetrahydrofolate cyclo-ligase [Candidatus Kryptobacter tengchongensis]|uniref:5-formyltetrahydrofolate cyclo-ligase n=1 Tax=Kryptobacter tengchongensis TaxID=1643429 RepID=UPI000707BBC2|nr:5-formyltetrahydrofolate cyclo-ligase [Candidatus Kryptobacter tengchongensis]CUS80368.1 5-formyltetrahydrofolate cyclo-ligase [Candidatus Kryptobacter tengchongensis]CUU05675.1 5-formyltetrahydrofolate cyclo-ligase [Candidatus Kryptobacter tengchongensis]